MSPLLEEGEPSVGFQPSEALVFTSDGGGTCDEDPTVLTLSQKHSELSNTKDKCQIASRMLVFQNTWLCKKKLVTSDF